MIVRSAASRKTASVACSVSLLRRSPAWLAATAGRGAAGAGRLGLGGSGRLRLKGFGGLAAAARLTVASFTGRGGTGVAGLGRGAGAGSLAWTPLSWAQTTRKTVV